MRVGYLTFREIQRTVEHARSDLRQLRRVQRPRHLAGRLRPLRANRLHSTPLHPRETAETRTPEACRVNVDGYLLDEGWTADIRTPWENLAEPELRSPAVPKGRRTTKRRPVTG